MKNMNEEKNKTKFSQLKNERTALGRSISKTKQFLEKFKKEQAELDLEFQKIIDSEMKK